MKNAFILTAVAAALLTTANTVSAHEPNLSPRAKANLIKSGAGSSTDALDRSILAGSPRGRAVVESLRKTAKSVSKADLAHGPLPKFSPRHTR